MEIKVKYMITLVGNEKVGEKIIYTDNCLSSIEVRDINAEVLYIQRDKPYK